MFEGGEESAGAGQANVDTTDRVGGTVSGKTMLCGWVTKVQGPALSLFAFGDANCIADAYKLKRTPKPSLSAPSCV